MLRGANKVHDHCIRCTVHGCGRGDPRCDHRRIFKRLGWLVKHHGGRSPVLDCRCECCRTSWRFVHEEIGSFDLEQYRPFAE